MDVKFFCFTLAFAAASMTCNGLNHCASSTPPFPSQPAKPVFFHLCWSSDCNSPFTNFLAVKNSTIRVVETKCEQHEHGRVNFHGIGLFQRVQAP